MRVLLAALFMLMLVACGQESSGPDESPANEDSTSQAENPEANRPTVAFLGTSLTIGLGVEPEQAYPSLIQQKIDSAGYDFRVINAGISGETSTGGLNRLDWLMRADVDVLVIELGANDGLRGVPLEVTRSNIEAVIEQARAKKPGIELVLAGMQMPPNLGQEYTSTFRELFPAIAQEKGVTLVPFLLEGVAGVDSLNQPDGIHPTPEGHKLLAATVWQVLQPILAEKATTAPE